MGHCTTGRDRLLRVEIGGGFSVSDQTLAFSPETRPIQGLFGVGIGHQRQPASVTMTVDSDNLPWPSAAQVTATCSLQGKPATCRSARPAR